MVKAETKFSSTFVFYRLSAYFVFFFFLNHQSELLGLCNFKEEWCKYDDKLVVL